MTKQVELDGWKRFEMNSTLSFKGVSEGTFDSILRRSLVVELRGNFVPAAVLHRQYPSGDGGEHGVFQKDPALKPWARSSSAAAALWRIVEGWIGHHTKQQCTDIIDHYVDCGGDGGLTEFVMRAACDLRPRTTHHSAHMQPPPQPSRPGPQVAQQVVILVIEWVGELCC